MKLILNWTLTLGIFLFIGCEDETVKNEPDTGNLFILCEGNFGSANASLWSLDLGNEESEVQANVYESITGTSLGDVANAMVIHNNNLYIINNNSHSLEVMSLGETTTHLTSVNLAMSSPRYMAFGNDKGYVTTWNNGIFVLDLNTNLVTDTISVNGMPEDILYNNGYLYVSVPLNSDWSTNDDILKIDASSKAIIDTFNVVSGPGRLLVSGSTLYAASNSYDLNWNSYAGMSAVDLSSGVVVANDYGMASNYGSDLVELDGNVYRATNSGIAPLGSDLSADSTNVIGDFSGVYSVVVSGGRILFGITDDYLAPDQIIITNLSGKILRSFDVGALPTDFAVFNK